MNRVDAHQHYWSLARGDYGWLTPRLGRLYRNFEPDDLRDAAFDAMLESDLTFDALVTPLHLSVLHDRLSRHPNLKAVLDHAGKPDIAGKAFDEWAVQIERVASRPALYCKLSGLLTQGASACTSDLDAYVAHIFACFGPERVMWGSDWPVPTVRASYREWLAMALELVRRYAPQHEDAVFNTNAVRLYALNRSGSAK
jgi:L-fuconolactonase